jgi:hypothetical protein
MKFIFTFGIFFFLSCSATDSSFKPQKVPKEFDYFWDNLAEFIACVPLKETNQFVKLTTRPPYLQYHKQMNLHWSKIQENYLNQVTAWKHENLTFISQNPTLYPLAGGDFINLFTFYPHSHLFVMIGLQKPGHIRDPRNFTDVELSKALNSVENLVWELAIFNYSTSVRLHKNVANPYFTGIAPTLLFFIKRFGFTILDLENIVLNPDGSVSKQVENLQTHSGIKIRFFKKEEGFIRELYFFKIWLSANSAKPITPEGKFIQGLGRFNLMLKSAEYIFHTREYESFVSALVSQADRVIQDESGFPLRFFNLQDWNVRVYGKYLGKIPLKNTPVVPFQNDLHEIFQKESQPLPFDFGYGVLKGKGMSNLIVLERKSLQSKTQP